MATLLDAPKSPNPAKVEEFVEKQLAAARRRVRVLDFFMAGLALAVASLVFLFAALLVDRYVEMPRGTWWAVVAGYLALATGYLYFTLFRPDRRQINPYFAARQVERVVPNAKNSLVSWVDFEEDPTVPGSIRTAIGHKAARDLKTVDLNRAIENRRIIWLAVAAAVFLVANVVLAILPPTRTELNLEEPKSGDVTVFSNQDVTFQVRVHGRIPGANDADAVRVRMWYNPDDPETYEDRPMKPAEDDRRKFALTVPAKQTRTGFRYKVLAGNTETREYTVTVKIIPEFTGFEVAYEFPAYLRREPLTNNDPNLLAPYGTTATVVATTNREVKHGHIEIEGQARTIEGRPVEGRPDAIQFTLTLEKEGFFRVWFTTPEGDKNQDPARLRLGVIDPKPVVRTFDIAYDYPAYLRFKPMLAADVREPEIEAPRGTNVVVTAKTTRGVKDAKLEIDGLPPITGELIPDEPTWVRFKLPTIDKDATARLTFTPTTDEKPSAPRSIPIRAVLDEAPRVVITKPEEDLKEIPANGTLQVEGLATDDHGVDRMTLRMKLLGAEDRDLAPKPYRGGMSFLRKEDNSWPTRVEYKDFVKLPDLKMPGNPNWKIGPGMEVEYWLEAVDNCAVPHPNPNVSKSKRFKVTAPAAAPKDKQQIDRQNRKAEQEQEKHEKNQDQRNATEKRDVQQPPPKGAEQGDKRNGEPQPQDRAGNENDPTGKPEGNQERNAESQAGTNPMGNPDHEKQTEQVKDALNRADQDNQPGGVRNDTRPPESAKVDPGAGRPPEPKTGPEGSPPPAENHDTKDNPNKGPMEDGAAGAPRDGKIDKTKQDKGETRDGGESQPGMEEAKAADKRTFGGSERDSAGDKPDTKDAPPMPGAAQKDQPQKGEARGKPQPKTGDGSDSTAGEQATPGKTKPDKDVTTGEDRRASSEPGDPKGNTPPKDAAASKPKEAPQPGGARPEPKKDEVTDTGGSRSGPKDDGTAGEEHKPPMGGTSDQTAKGEQKGGPGTPPPGAGDQGELDRELGGELDREISSPNPKIDPKKKSDVERLMREKQNREKIRQKLNELEQKANSENDELKKKKVQDLRAAAEQAAKEYDAEKPNKDNVEQLSKKLNSNDPKERGDAEQRIKDWEKDQQAKKDLQDEVEQLKKKDRNAGERVDDAMKKAEQARNQSGGQDQTPKVDEKDLSQIAKDLNGSDEKAKADAERKLEQIAKDPKAAKEAQDKLQQMANKAQDPKEKQNLQDAARKAGEMAKEMAKNDGQPKGPDPKDVEKAAKDLASADPKTREEAMKNLQKMMRDPKAREQAQKMAKEMADNAKTPEDKQALENAAKQMEQLAKEMGNKETPKLNPQDLKDLAKQMAGKDEKAKQDAAKKLQDLMKDPKSAEQAQKMLEEMAKNAKNSPEDQKALDEALKQAQEMAKNGPPPQIKPQDLKDLAQKMKEMSPEEKEKLKQEIEKAMKDPDRRKELEKAAQEMAKNMPPDQKKEWDDMMRSLGGDFVSPPGKPEQADLKNKLKSAELLLDEFKQKVADDRFRREFLKWGDDQVAQWMKDQEMAIAAMRRQLENTNFGQDRSVRPLAGGGPTGIKLDPKDSGDGRSGGRYAPPSGYVDPYKRLTGGSQANEPPKR